jgi:type VI secretion system protein ImpA
LDPDDDNDPTFRVNTLVSLCDADTTLKMLKRAALVDSPKLGRFGLFHVAIANWEIPAPEDMESPPDTATIEAAFMDADLDALKATREAIQQSIDHVRQIEAGVTNHVGAANAASLEPLVSVLQEADKLLTDQLAKRGVRDDAAGDEAATQEAAAGDGSGEPMSLQGEVRSRQDVVHLLDKICEYYERYEPSSPLPLLLRRAQRLTNMGFMEILRELTPGGVAEAESLGGLMNINQGDDAAGSSGGSTDSGGW